MSSNTITIVGNLVRDAEAKDFGTSNLTKLRLATNERVNKDGQWTDGESTYIDVSAWRKLGTAAAGLQKGQKVIVTGKLKGRAFKHTDGRDGYGYEIDATDIGISILFSSPKVVEEAAAKPVAAVEPDLDNPWEDEAA
jgi:single-strand DNA-binding protein